MVNETPDTYFAPAGRDTAEDFSRKQEIVRNSPLLAAALNAIPGMVMILNTNRQIVAVNQAMLRVLQVTADDLLEKRPGEVVGCVRPKEGPDGCGTSRHCVTCGAVNAILESQTQNTQVVRECRILTQKGADTGALDLRVAATPIVVEGEHFIVVAAEDISQPKRLAVLQRVFFHDVLNTAGCISGYADYLVQQHEAVGEVSELLTHLSEQLIEEINAQRDLVLAESGDLTLQADMVPIRPLLDELRADYSKNLVAADRNIALRNIWAGIIWTDRRLLLRVLGNMLKNALEATAIAGENHEFEDMYPKFIQAAQEEGNADAVTSFRNAMAVEKTHYDLYRKALEALDDGRDVMPASIYVCSECGHTVWGKAPDECPVCGASRFKFKEVV